MLAAPALPGREIPPAAFLNRALVAAKRCGMTRLADITRLDRIGFPVWQAVRPAGRALSVHQGKGATHIDARIGAACEAIESHAAEHAPADGPVATWAALAPKERAVDPTDYLRDRGRGPCPSAPIRWCEAEDVATGARQFLPHDLVSLDFTRAADSLFDRSSSGLAVGTCREEALLAGLHEVIERDAVGDWLRRGPLERMRTTVAPGSIASPWFAYWQDRLAACGAGLSVHLPPAAIRLPVVVCVLSGPAEYGPPRVAMGSAAHGDPEAALFKAFAEAAQSRLTLIAGARDDISAEISDKATMPPVPPIPSGFPARAWDAVAPGPGSLHDLVAALAAEGYRQAVFKPLDGAGEGMAVVKTFVPGLGGPHRARRTAR